ncbi:MAG TPA: iron-containing alcohol dehydrogenase [Gaiellales bacterium]
MSARDDWTLVDGERLVRYGRGSVSRDAPALLQGRGFEPYALVTTERASASMPLLAERAAVVAFAGKGLVADVAVTLRPQVTGFALVALGGGRVIDSAKAIAAAERHLRPEGVAAIPTTLSGAELTQIHRLLPDTTGGPVRPSLVLCDPGLMASQPMPALAASAMNALAHACEACWNANGSPLTDVGAAEGARLLVEALELPEPDRDALALGAVQAAYAFGLVGVGVHHLVCQTLVQRLGLPHATTNAIVLPHVLALVASREPASIVPLERVLDGRAEARVRGVARRAGGTRLRDLGCTLDACRALVPVMLARPELSRTPWVGEQDLAGLVEAAW